LCGLAALTEPSVLSVLPFLAMWACYRRHKQQQRWAGAAVLATLAFVVVIAPWSVRNYRIFHRFIPLRSGFGLELYVGNNGSSEHWVNRSMYPAHSDAELSEFEAAGEILYMQHKLHQALAFIQAHKGFFLWMSLRRAIYLWTGFWSFSHNYLLGEPLDPANVVICTTLTILALMGLTRAFRQGHVASVPFLIVLLLFPLVYCITHPEVYYRRPIDPLFVVLAVYAVTAFLEGRRSRAVDA